MYHEINSYKKVASQIIESSSYEPVHLLPRSKNVSVPKFRRSTVRPKFSTELDRSVKNVVGGFGQTTEARPNFLSPDLFFGFLLRKKNSPKNFLDPENFYQIPKKCSFSFVFISGCQIFGSDLEMKVNLRIEMWSTSHRHLPL